MADVDHTEALNAAADRARSGGPERHREKAVSQGRLPVRDRVERLLDPGSFAEEGLLANWEQDGLGADGVVTGMGTTGGRPVPVMGKTPTGQAGSGGPQPRRQEPGAPERPVSTPICHRDPSASP